MTKKQIAVLASRIMAIVAFIRAITFTQLIGFQVSSNSQMPMNNKVISTIFTFLPILLLILFALFLWLFAESLAEYVIPEDKQGSIISIPCSELQIIGFSIIGLFVLTSAVPDFVSNILRYYLIEKQNPFFDGYNPGYIIQFSTDFLKVLIGFALLFGAKGLAGLIKTFRYAGIPDKDD